jgi:hypothetical protein
MFMGWVLFTLWTMRLLLIPESDDLVYRFGVPRFGVTIWIAASGVSIYLALRSNPSHSGIYYAAVIAFFLFPICLWAGWGWGIAMRAFFPNVLKR